MARFQIIVRFDAPTADHARAVARVVTADAAATVQAFQPESRFDSRLEVHAPDSNERVWRWKPLDL